MFSGRLFKFMAFIGDSGEPRPFQIWFPVTDRRLARRIARKTGQRFSWRDGQADFRPKKLRQQYSTVDSRGLE